MFDPQPRMSEVEFAMFARSLARGGETYLEWGAGGSTLAAVRAPFGRIVTVESDPAWLDRLAAHPEIETAKGSGRAVLRHADIGPVAEWGQPVDESGMRRWPRYVGAAWAICERLTLTPDLVLVDGRFRTACALSLLLAAPPGAVPPLLFHDFMPETRRNYAPLLGFYEVAEQVETLALLRPRADTAPAALIAAFCEAMLDRT
jgi:hypothetical protein